MRSVLVLLMTAVSIACAPLSANSQCPDNRPAVTVQIHDYVHLKGEALSAAKEVVTRAYKNVGVGIAWVGVLQDAGQPGTHTKVAQLTINILTPSMAARGGVPENVLGFVAVPPEGGMGRIGYVVYERVPEIAAATQMAEGDVLGVILAHDIRRLILGNDSESNDGVAKDRGDGRNRERADPFALQFTPSEVAQLRATLERDSATFPGAIVGTAGTDPKGQCITGGDGIRE
jgi:CBS domain-containing protein